MCIMTLFSVSVHLHYTGSLEWAPCLPRRRYDLVSHFVMMTEVVLGIAGLSLGKRLSFLYIHTYTLCSIGFLRCA